MSLKIARSFVLEMFISAENIPRSGRLHASKSDPFAVLQIETDPGKYRELGRTETIENAQDAEFQEQFLLDYVFQEKQSLRVCLFDNKEGGKVSSDQVELDKAELLGEAFFTSSELVLKRGQNLKLRLMKNDSEVKNSFIIVKGEEASNSKDLVSLQFSASGLDKMDIIGSSDAL